jgi:lipoprotein-releasing system permease protein
MNSNNSGRSGLIVNIAIAAVAISVAVMLIAVAVVKGYQLQITNKITGFSNHIQITRLDFNNSFETNPIQTDSQLVLYAQTNPQIAFIQPYVLKTGIIKTTDEFEGVVLKGVNNNYHWDFIRKHLKEGRLPMLNDTVASLDVLISEALSRKLKIGLNQPLVVYFIQDGKSMPRARKFKVSGIYNTGFEDLDALYALVDLRHLQKLNNWQPNQLTGYEVGLVDYKLLDVATEQLIEQASIQLEVKKVTELYPQLFDWLGLLDLNVLVIIILMIIVACMNMSTALLILIVERSNMIGILKALGSTNRFIQEVFLTMAARLIVKGLLIGNFIGLTICTTQYYFGWIKLNQETYFLNVVPIELSITDALLINAGAFALCVLVMVLPAKFVSNITPVKAIKFQ